MDHTTLTLVAAAVRVERERCAAVCRAIAAYPGASDDARDAAADCAAAILARGDAEAVVSFSVNNHRDAAADLAIRIAILDR